MEVQTVLFYCPSLWLQRTVLSRKFRFWHSALPAPDCKELFSQGKSDSVIFLSQPLTAENWSPKEVQTLTFSSLSPWLQKTPLFRKLGLSHSPVSASDCTQLLSPGSSGSVILFSQPLTAEKWSLMEVQTVSFSCVSPWLQRTAHWRKFRLWHSPVSASDCKELLSWGSSDAVLLIFQPLWLQKTALSRKFHKSEAILQFFYIFI